jgi:hypothetical protein
MEVCILTIGHSPSPGSCQLRHSSPVAIPAPAYPRGSRSRVFVILAAPVLCPLNSEL